MAMMEPATPQSNFEGEKVDTEPMKDINEDVDVEATQSRPGIPTATDWYPDAARDPANPHNWSMLKRIFHTAVPTSIAFLWFVQTTPRRGDR